MLGSYLVSEDLGLESKSSAMRQPAMATFQD